MFLGVAKLWGEDNLVSVLSDKGILKRHPSDLLNFCEVSILKEPGSHARLILHEEVKS